MGGAGGAKGDGFLPCRAQALPSLAPGQLGSSWTRRIAWDTREYREPGAKAQGQGRVSWLGIGAAWPKLWWDPSPGAERGLGEPVASFGAGTVLCHGWWQGLGGAGGHCRGNPWCQGSLKQPRPLPSSHRDPPVSWGRKETRWVQRQGGPAGGCATSHCAMATGMAAPTGMAPPRCPSLGLRAAWGISRATSRTPQPRAASHRPRGQGEPCEVCPTVSEGMLGATGLPGKPGPRGAPGAPGKDGVSVSLNMGG